MKKINILLSFLILLIFGGCSSTASLPHLQAEGDGLENDKGNFVELNDGRIVTGNIEKNSLGHVLTFKKVGNVTIDGVKYAYKDISAFQNDKKYFRKDAYNNFNQRIVKGNISVYKSERTGESVSSKGVTRSFDYTLFFIQKGSSGPVIAFELKELKKMIADYQPAVSELEKYEALSKKEKRTMGNSYLSNVITVYNNKK